MRRAESEDSSSDQEDFKRPKPPKVLKKYKES